MTSRDYRRTTMMALFLIGCACGEVSDGRRPDGAKTVTSDSASIATPEARPAAVPADTIAPPSATVTSACDSAAAAWSSIPNARVDIRSTVHTVETGGRTAACEVDATASGGMDRVVAARLFFPSEVYGNRVPRDWAELWRLGTGMEGQETHYLQRDKVRCEVRDHTDTSDDDTIPRSRSVFGQDITCWEEANRMSPADTARHPT